MGKLSPGGKEASHETKSYFSEMDGIPYRFVVVYSSALDERKHKALDKMMEAGRAKIQKQPVIYAGGISCVNPMPGVLS